MQLTYYFTTKTAGDTHAHKVMCRLFQTFQGLERESSAALTAGWVWAGCGQQRALEAQQGEGSLWGCRHPLQCLLKENNPPASQNTEEQLWHFSLGWFGDSGDGLSLNVQSTEVCGTTIICCTPAWEGGGVLQHLSLPTPTLQSSQKGSKRRKWSKNRRMCQFIFH